MLRQLARQRHQQRQQEQQQMSRHTSAGRELPAKQDQARRTTGTEASRRDAFGSDQ
jgi:hypothetical protein